jgi:hypothetical protein
MPQAAWITRQLELATEERRAWPEWPKRTRGIGENGRPLAAPADPAGLRPAGAA